MKINFTLFFILICGVSISFAQTTNTELGGRAVVGEVVTISNLSPSNIDGATFELTTSSVRVTPDENVLRILRDRGIFPDSETYALIYDLNPGFYHLASLDTETNLVLPIAIGNGAFTSAVKNGHLVMITLDGALKKRLEALVLEVKQSSEKFANQNRSRFLSAAKRRDSIALVSELSDWFGHINKTILQRTSKPISKTTLIQIIDEAEALATILKKINLSSKKVQDADLSKINAIHQDLEDLIEIWDQSMSGELPAGEPQYKVIVTIRGGNEEQIRNLRIYYVVNGLFHDPPVKSSSFNTLGSGSYALLSIKNYKIWAAADGHPSDPVTYYKDLMVRKPTSGDTISVDISLK